MKALLKTTFDKLKFKNPVLVASGTFGYAKEFERFFDVSKLGGVVTKTITLNPRLGNPPQRVYETPGGMLNAIGLQNVGVDRFIEEKLPYLKKLKIPIIVSIMGYQTQELSELVKKLDRHKSIAGYELNLSCPNVKYSTQNRKKKRAPKMFAHDPKLIKQAVGAARKHTKKTLIAKLGPDVSDVGLLAQAAESAGADAISLINTLSAMAIDLEKRKPVLHNVTGGLSGPCVKPVALRMVWEVYRSVSIPIMGMGGITCAKDALEFMIAGATLVQVGTQNFVNPRVSLEIIQGIEKYFKKHKITSTKEIIGSLKTP